MLGSTRYIFQITHTLSSKRFMMLMVKHYSCYGEQNTAQRLGKRRLTQGNALGLEEIYVSPRSSPKSAQIKSRVISRAMIAFSQQAKCSVTQSRRIHTITAEKIFLEIHCHMYCNFYLKRHFAASNTKA